MSDRTVNLEFTSDELSLLELHLRRHLDLLDRELVRTEKRELHHAIAQEVLRMENLLSKIQRTIVTASEEPTAWPHS
jgi:hypothetical protein